MRSLTLFVLLIISMTATSPLFANDKITGSRLLKDCKTAIKVFEADIEQWQRYNKIDAMAASFCTGYISGLIDMDFLKTWLSIQTMGIKPTNDVVLKSVSLCIPKNMRKLDLIKFVVNGLEKEKDSLDVSASLLVFEIIKDKYNCRSTPF